MSRCLGRGWSHAQTHLNLLFVCVGRDSTFKSDAVVVVGISVFLRVSMQLIIVPSQCVSVNLSALTG